MDWHEKYKDKIVSREQAVRLIRSGDVITSNFGGSIPYALLDALADYAPGHLEDVTLYLAGFYKPARIADAQYNAQVRIKSCFLGPWERRAAAEGSDLSYQAMHLANINHDRMGKHRARVLLAAGSEPDEYGMISLADPEDTMDWYRMVCTCFDRYGIGRAAWSFREMDFGLIDPHADSIRERLLKVL